jgi:hypothetical protein
MKHLFMTNIIVGNLPNKGQTSTPPFWSSELTASINIPMLDLQLPVQSVPITCKVVSSNPADDEVYSMQHYVIKFVTDL